MLIDLSYKAVVEGLLFMAESPMSVSELAKIIGIDESGVEEALTLLKADYA